MTRQSDDPITAHYLAEIQKPLPSEASEKEGPGFMGWLDMLFSLLHPDHDYDEKLRKYGMPFNQSAALPAPEWTKDTWTRIEEVQSEAQGRTAEDAASIIFKRSIGDVKLLKADILTALNDPASKEKTQNTIDEITELAQKENLDPNLILNNLWNPQTDSVDMSYAANFIADIAKINEITGNTALSILVQQSGGLSREATENNLAFTGLLEKTLIKLQERENFSNPNNPRTLNYSDIMVKSPAHLNVILGVLREDGNGMIAANHLQNHDEFWTKDTRTQALQLMQQANMPLPQHELNLIKDWDNAAASAHTHLPDQQSNNPQQETTDTYSVNVSSTNP